MRNYISVCCLLLATSFANASSVRDVSDDLVTALPGLNGITPNFNQYSGYLDAGNGIMLHYVFVESQSNPQTDPLLLWLNGGPGCSSMEGLFSELGPFYVNEDGATLYENEYSWNTFANVVFLESPACVGYSYSTENDCSASDNSTATANYNALVQFFTLFPEYSFNEFYVTGESYGGIYVPSLSLKIVENQATFPINLQGFAVGNGMSSFEMNDNSLIFFGNYHGLFGQDLWDSLVANCCEGGIQSEKNCHFQSGINSLCQAEVDVALVRIYNTGLNMYNLYGDCEYSDSSSANEFSRYHADALLSFRNRRMSRDNPFTRADPPCIDSSAMTSYLNLAETRQALHIPDTLGEWSICSTRVSLVFETQYESMYETYKQLSDAGIRGLVYTGDVDMACNFIMNQWFVESLEYEVLEAYQPWYVGNQVGGFVKRFELLDLLTVLGSGHMVPEDKPVEALQMIRAFVFGGSY